MTVLIGLIKQGGIEMSDENSQFRQIERGVRITTPIEKIAGQHEQNDVYLFNVHEMSDEALHRYGLTHIKQRIDERGKTDVADTRI